MKRTTLFQLAIAAAAVGLAAPASAQMNIAGKYGCVACHAQAKRAPGQLGPGYGEIAEKYKGQKVEAKLFDKVRKGGIGSWPGTVPMPPNPSIPDADLKAMIAWILAGAK
jgi:cytochrome c